MVSAFVLFQPVFTSGEEEETSSKEEEEEEEELILSSDEETWDEEVLEESALALIGAKEEMVELVAVLLQETMRRLRRGKAKRLIFFIFILSYIFSVNVESGYDL